MADDTSSLNTIELATELTIAWLGNPNTRASNDEVPAFLNTMHEAVLGIFSGATSNAERSEASSEYKPATTVRRSLSSKDHIISMIDGKPYKTLRRHLSGHGLTPEQYRDRYGLKSDYPMVAPNYSEARRSMVQKIGLGRNGRAARKTALAQSSSVEKPRRGRKSRAARSEES